MNRYTYSEKLPTNHFPLLGGFLTKGQDFADKPNNASRHFNILALQHSINVKIVELCSGQDVSPEV